MLEIEEALVTKIVQRPSLTHYHRIFDTKAIFPISGVARIYALLVNLGVRQGKGSSFEAGIPGFNGAQCGSRFHVGLDNAQGCMANQLRMPPMAGAIPVIWTLYAICCQ